MPATEARQALTAQECAHMQQHHAARIVEEELGALEFDFTVGRVVCVGLADGNRFTWEAWEACGLCGDTGELLGADSKAYDCPKCDDLVVETFSTDCDGRAARVEA